MPEQSDTKSDEGNSGEQQEASDEGTTGRQHWPPAGGRQKARPHGVAEKDKKHRKPDPFAKQREEFEARKQAELQRELDKKERSKKLRIDRSRRFAKKAKHMERTPKGQPIMRNVLAQIMSKFDKK